MKLARVSFLLIGLASIMVVAIVLLISTSSEADQPHNDDESWPTTIVCNSEISSEMQPCVAYLTRYDDDIVHDDEPSHECCEGMKALQSMFAGDRVGVCKCIQRALSNNNVFKDERYGPERMSIIPNKCAFNFTFPPIAQDTDCCSHPILEAPYGI